MKKLVSVLLCIVMISAVLAPAVKASVNDTLYPTVVVAGYSSSDLYINGEKIWGLDMNGVLNTVLSKIAQVGRGLGELALQRPDYFSDLVGKEIVNLAGKMAMNPDGSSVYDITTYDQSAAKTQYSYLIRELDGQHTHEKEMFADIAAEYGENGYDYLFAYQQDFRLSMVDCAANLDKYIDSVLEFTGADKVNVFAVSHGGQTVATYLAMYGLEKNVINNAVLYVPAIGGAALAYDLMSETVVFDEETLFYFIENGQMLEEDINWLVRANQFGILDDVCNILMHRYVKKVLGYWGSIWDFIPAEYYEDLKNQMLDPQQSADIIEKSDYFHYEILPHLTETFTGCCEEGMNIYLVAGAGMPSVTGLQEQSDAIITVNASTAAKTAPYGSRFNDGYQQVRTVCTEETHNHLSPDMCVDLSCGYLPDHTWIINGMFHDMGWKDKYVQALCKMLLFSKERADVYTYPEFPQFKYSTNRNYSAAAAMDKSEEGYMTGADTAITVTNLSHKYKMRLISISVDGIDVSFDIKNVIYLDPGASVTVPMQGALPETSLVTADITINYSLLGSITPLGSRTLVFTVMNGQPPQYDAANPYTDAFHVTAFENGISESASRILKRIGFFDWLKMVINSMLTVLRTFRIK